MPFRALVIDDDYPGRRDQYLRLAHGSLAEASFDLQVAAMPLQADQIATLCEQAQVGLVDIYLDPLGRADPFEIASGINVLDLIHERNPQLPIFLVSSHWDNLTMPIYRDLISRKQIVGGVSLRLLDDISECARARLDLVRAVQDARGFAATSLGPDEELLLLHLSDLQVGAPWVGGGGDLQAAGDQLVNEVFQALPTAPNGKAVAPHLLAVTGDVAEHGEPAEFRAGFGLLEKLRSRLGVSREGCFVVPGNHDVCLPMASSHLIEYSFSSPFALGGKSRNPRTVAESRMRGLDRFGLVPFQEACSAFTGRGDWNARVEFDADTQPTSWFHSQAFAALGVSLLGINTVTRLGPEDPANAQVSQTVVNQIASRLDAIRQRETGYRDLVHLVLLHHSPWAGMGDPTLHGNGGEYLLSQLERFGDCIVLFGHIHTPITNVHTYTLLSSRQALFASPSTATLRSASRPEDSLRGFHLITLERRNDMVTGARIKQFEYSGFQYQARGETAFRRDRLTGWVARP